MVWSTVALHVEDEHLVAQRVGYVDSLRGGVHCDAGGPLEVAFAALQAADGAEIFSAGLEDEDLAGIRIGYVDIVLGIDRDALRREHRVLAFSAALDELVLVLREVEDVHAPAPGSVTMIRPRESVAML